MKRTSDFHDINVLTHVFQEEMQNKEQVLLLFMIKSFYVLFTIPFLFGFDDMSFF